jgi:hypothetical protein
MKLFALLSLIILPLFCPSQNRKIAAKEITSLKNGALLVRLKTGELQAAALERSGDQAKAAEYRKKQEAENKAIVLAFRSNFRFCPVYFFFSSSSTQIRNKDLKGCFLKPDLLPDSSLAPVLSGFLTAEFGKSDKQQIEGLILMDEQFVQLSAPFPFLVRKYENPIHGRSIDEMVIQLEKNLQDFAKRN